MTWKPGQSGNPGGRPDTKRIRAAFVRLYDADPKKLDQLAAAAHEAAVKHRDLAALTFIRDTLDGKPAQESVITRINGTVDLSDTEIAARIAALSDEKPSAHTH